MAKGIAVIGGSESVKGFSAVGIDVFPCGSGEEAAKIFHKIAVGEAYAVVFIAEEMFESTRKEREKHEEKLCPAVVPLPTSGKSDGTGMKRLSSFVERAVGSDIIFND